MILGIPRGFFYYDYLGFLGRLFAGTGIVIRQGRENDESILEQGKTSTVDEACGHIKLFAGQVADLAGRCDRILIPRMMKDCEGKWLCPKLLGLPELVRNIPSASNALITAPLYFNDEKKLKHGLERLWRELGLSRSTFHKNFKRAYRYQREISEGTRTMHMEAGWEFTPPMPRPGEIRLPNMGKVLVIGHNYNVFDRFANGDIMRRLDRLGIEPVTEHQVSQQEKRRAAASLSLVKEPFWEAFTRILGTTLCQRKEVEGIIYLSSFSCGLDAFLVEMLKTQIPELPLLVLKLDEHKGEAGFETRVEAFADLLERRRAS